MSRLRLTLQRKMDNNVYVLCSDLKVNLFRDDNTFDKSRDLPKEPQPVELIFTTLPYHHHNMKFRNINLAPPWSRHCCRPFDWLDIHSEPINPCSTAVDMEPYSNSAFINLRWIFATSTKIFPNSSSIIPNAHNFYTTTAPTYLLLSTLFTSEV